MIDIVISTANRPQLLRQALHSVSAQTARGQISRVLVSENGGNRESARVCAEFPELPIEYVFREPAITALEHGRVLLVDSLRDKYAAILHDDDWWGPEYLSRALAALESDASCVAVFSHYFETQGPGGFFQVAPRLWLLWVACDCDFSAPILRLSREQVLLGCLLMTCFHYSTTVGRTEVIRDAYQQVVDSGNDYDNDRLFGTFMAAHGHLAYLTRPDVFIRIHPDQDCRRPDLLANNDNHQLPVWQIRSIATIRWLRQKEPEVMASAAVVFNGNFNGLSEGQKSQVRSLIPISIQRLLDDECGFQMVAPPPVVVPPVRDWKWALKQVCPPAVLGIKRKLRPMVAKKN